MRLYNHLLALSCTLGLISACEATFHRAIAVDGSRAQADASSRSLSVTGTATIPVEPDTVHLSIGVHTSPHAPADASDVIIAGIAASLRDFGRVGAVRVWGSTNTHEVVVAPTIPSPSDSHCATDDMCAMDEICDRGRCVFSAGVPPPADAVVDSLRVVDRQLAVTLFHADAADIDIVLASAMNAGAASVSIQRYALREPKAHIQDARQHAMEDAIARANHLARSLGLSLGRVTAVSESSSDPSSLMLYGEGAQVLVAASVTLTFELEAAAGPQPAVFVARTSPPPTGGGVEPGSTKIDRDPKPFSLDCL